MLKMKSFFCCISLSLCIALLLCSCSLDISSLLPANESESSTEEASGNDSETTDTEVDSSTLSLNKTFGIPYYPEEKIDPYAALTEINRELCALLYDSLFCINASGEYEPQAALAAETENGTSWKVTLREGMTFHDGSPVTAQDVKASALAAKNGEYYSAQLENLSSVTVEEDGSILFILTEPSMSFIQLLDFPIVASDADESAYEGYALLGSGRYSLSVEIGEEEDTTLFLNYYSSWYGYDGEVPTVESMELLPAEDKEELFLRYANGELDILRVDSDEEGALSLRGDTEVYTTTGDSLYYIGFQTQAAPFSSTEARKALTALINYDTLSARLPEDILARMAGADRYFPEGHVAREYMGEWEQTNFDASAITSVWDSMEVEPKRVLTLVASDTSEIGVAIAEAVAELLQEAGFEVKLSLLTYDNYVWALYNGEYSLYVGKVSLGANEIPTDIISPGKMFARARAQAADLEGEIWVPDYPISEDLAAECSLLGDISPLSDSYAADLAEQMTVILRDYAPFIPLAYNRVSVVLRGSFAGNVEITARNPYYNIEKWTAPGQSGTKTEDEEQ